MTPQEQIRLATTESLKIFEHLAKRAGLDFGIQNDIDSDDPQWEETTTGYGISGYVGDGDCPYLVLTQSVVIPGCHTLDNGDPGYPDDIDILELETANLWLDDVEKIAVKVFQYFGHAVVDEAIDAYMEQKQWEEFEDAYQGLERDEDV